MRRHVCNHESAAQAHSSGTQLRGWHQFEHLVRNLFVQLIAAEMVSGSCQHMHQFL